MADSPNAKPGNFNHASITVRDLYDAKRFYTEVLGGEVVLDSNLCRCEKEAPHTRERKFNSCPTLFSQLERPAPTFAADRLAREDFPGSWRQNRIAD